jgi:hypothetical protein
MRLAARRWPGSDATVRRRRRRIPRDAGEARRGRRMPQRRASDARDVPRRSQVDVVGRVRGGATRICSAQAPARSSSRRRRCSERRAGHAPPEQSRYTDEPAPSGSRTPATSAPCPHGSRPRPQAGTQPRVRHQPSPPLRRLIWVIAPRRVHHAEVHHDWIRRSRGLGPHPPGCSRRGARARRATPQPRSNHGNRRHTDAGA